MNTEDKIYKLIAILLSLILLINLFCIAYVPPNFSKPDDVEMLFKIFPSFFFVHFTIFGQVCSKVYYFFMPAHSSLNGDYLALAQRILLFAWLFLTFKYRNYLGVNLKKIINFCIKKF